VDRFFQRVLDRSVIRVIRYIVSRVSPQRQPFEDVFDIVGRRAAASSADYIEAHLDGAMLFRRREEVWDFALSNCRIEGLFAEFGVHAGDSINHIAAAVRERQITVYGFDSFEGLKENWKGTWYRAGHFSLEGNLPQVLSNVSLVKGWFDETLPRFLADHPNQPMSFIHLDADTFESTTLLLAHLADRIVKGTIIVLDEYLGFPNWQRGEFLAWHNFVEARGLKYRYLAFSNTPAAIEVL
jgi:hypothetical protein